MSIYIWMFINTVFFAFLIENKIQLSKKYSICIQNKNVLSLQHNFISYFLLFIPMWAIMAFRYNIGKDFGNYQYIFKTILQKKELKSMEVETGFYYLNKIVSIISDNTQSIFIVVAFIMLILFISGFKKNSRGLIVQLAVFMGAGYYFYAMNIMRQYLAISMICASFYLLEKEKYIKFLLILILASLFHQSVLIWIPIIFIVKITSDKLFYIGTLTVAFILKVGYKKIIGILTAYIPYAKYFIDNSAFIQERVSWYNVLITAMVLLAYLVKKDRIIKINLKNKERIKYVWIMFLAYIFLNNMGDSIIRLVLNFFFLIPSLISDFIETFDNKVKILMKMLIVIFMLILMCFLLNYSGNKYNNFIPYVSCFDLRTK